MIKKIIQIVIFFGFLLLILFNVITNPPSFYENIITSLSIWLYNVYPSLFTFYIIASCLINFNIIKKIAFIAKPMIKFDNNKAYELFITSIFVGNPSSTSLIMNELEQNSITKNDANKLLKVCSFFNPLYIIAIITITYQYKIKYAFIIMISILITNIIIGLFYKSENKPIILENHQTHNIKLNNVFTAINQAVSLLLLVAGIMVFTNILKHSITNFLNYINISSPITSFILSLFEVSTGLVDNYSANYSLITTISIASFMFAFQGISVNMQNANIMLDYKINYLPIFIIRIIQGLVSGCITFLILNI